MVADMSGRVKFESSKFPALIAFQVEPSSIQDAAEQLGGDFKARFLEKGPEEALAAMLLTCLMPHDYNGGLDLGEIVVRIGNITYRLGQPNTIGELR